MIVLEEKPKRSFAIVRPGLAFTIFAVSPIADMMVTGALGGNGRKGDARVPVHRRRNMLGPIARV